VQGARRWRTLHNQRVHDVFTSPYTVLSGRLKSGRMREMGSSCAWEKYEMHTGFFVAALRKETTQESWHRWIIIR
jgi:hypothetical protein